VLFPEHEGAIPQRITSNGNIYGCYHDTDLMGTMFGFARTASGFTAIDVPASMHTGATPDGSTIVGLYSDLTILPSPTHGYVIQDGNFQSFDVPSSTFTLHAPRPIPRSSAAMGDGPNRDQGFLL
jgi:hypothetical protein